MRIEKGIRKPLFYGWPAFLAINAFAYYSHASFGEFSAFITGWLAAMLTAHVTQQVKAPGTQP